MLNDTTFGIAEIATSGSLSVRAHSTAHRAGALICGALLPVLILVSGPALANPEGGRVTAGEAVISGEGTDRVLVTQTSERTLIDWQRFSIDAGETTRFIQPSANALAANRVVGGDPSEIFGSLEANGRVVLINRNGVLFGRNSRVDAAGLLATVHDLDGSSLSESTLRFGTPGVEGATVVNEGTITVRETGLAALVAPRVRNRGTIRADRVTLAAARGFALDLYGDGLLRFAPGDALLASPGEGALVESDGLVEAGAEVHLSAQAAEAVVNASVNVNGVVRARRASQSGGVIRLEGSGEVRVAPGARIDASGANVGGEVQVDAGSYVNEGAVLAEGTEGAGGLVRIAGSRVGLGGRVSASGASGGDVVVEAQGLLSLGERVEARGTDGAGGEVRYVAGRTLETSGAVTDVSGRTDGGRIVVKADALASSGEYRASANVGRGGYIDIEAADLRLLSARLDASGRQQGGLVRLGGAFRGGEESDQEAAWYGSMVDRWGELPGLASARETFVNDGTTVDVSSSRGSGGTVVAWSDARTTFLGSVNALGFSDGGTVALSSAGEVRHGSLSGIEVGGGHLLVEGDTITVGNPQALEAWSYAAALGVAQTTNLGGTPTGGYDIDVAPLSGGDRLGRSVSLNDTGDRLAVGAPGAEFPFGRGGSYPTHSGAVYLFTFSGTAFSGGTLAAVLGKDRIGSRNFDVALLNLGDRFGTSVSLNGTGDRLAVGAPGDDGRGNRSPGTGAAYLFTFTDSSFSGARLAGIVGRGYTGGRNLNVELLQGNGQRLIVPHRGDYGGDQFGTSVSLNGSGNLLVVGAPGNSGADNRTPGSGAAYLFTFSNPSFSGGRLAGIVGRGYTGGKDVNVVSLEGDGWNYGNSTTMVRGDHFGASVSLSGSGDRLAVGAPGDGGADNRTADNRSGSGSGAVYLFTFTDTAFSSGTLAAVLGAGYTGSRNLDVTVDYKSYEFGAAVSLNDAGSRLAVGAPGDDGRANGIASGSHPNQDSGAVYLFTFADTAFSSGTLAAVLGKGRAGRHNVDVALDGSDQFGTAVSLNGAGNLLAVGAPGDDGRGNSSSSAGDYGSDTGAVLLFTFSDTVFSGGSLIANVGKGYNDRNVHVASGPRPNYRFASAVSLNEAGTRLAVGSPGAISSGTATGAVYLFTFTDRSFSGGRLAAIVGRGNAGGRNVDVAGLKNNSDFGASVSLNAAGNRLAVGVPGDNGADGKTNNVGAVYLFTFADRSFSGGQLAGIVGAGYTGGKNVRVSGLREDNKYTYFFGRSVSLNASGDRLAVGAKRGAGEVYLFTFTDPSFSGGRLAAVVGKDVTGGKNINVDLDEEHRVSRHVRPFDGSDEFGVSVSLNGMGDRLAVGAWEDDGVDNSARDVGAVYLFTFADRSFSGGRLAAIVGKGYTGGRNVNVTGLDARDDDIKTGSTAERFGFSVSLNAVGDRLAVGAPGDDGFNNTEFDVGAVYLFTFADRSFSGGRLAAIMGSGYARGRDVDVAALTGGRGPYDNSTDRFGSSVSLNGPGDRLAVGAPGRDSARSNSGNPSVYLFTFTDTDFSGGALASTVGWGYSSGRTSGKNISVVDVQSRDEFGVSVSMNSAGDLLAVGAPGDGGAGSKASDAGAVYLFTFTDAAFSGGTLTAIVGKDYAGGRNVDVAELEREDGFGAAVSLNRAGTRLAVGAPGDDGDGNTAFDAGAVYLFTFTNAEFSGGQLATVMGRDYAGGNVDLAGLDNDDRFGASVSLNGAGDRLAVGAWGDDGPGVPGYGASAMYDTGAVYLFTFANTSFSGARLAATVGKGYVGGNNVGVRGSEEGDRFGVAVSLNAAGNRLAVGAPGDDGASNTAFDAGAVYLFSFADGSFFGGKLEAVVGKGTRGGQDIAVIELEGGDRFGAAVSLNDVGNRLAVGAPGDDGASSPRKDNPIKDSGAVYLFTVERATFSSARLAATLGKGYVGGKNVNLRALDEHDGFGAAVSLNGAGDRLAVGAPFDDGIRYRNHDAGAVYLFTFADTAYSDGRLVAIMGKNYLGSDGTH